MTKKTTASTLNRLAVVLATGVTFMATVDIASAKGDHHDNNGGSHFANNMHSKNSRSSNSAHSMNAKKGKADHKAKKEASCKKKDCAKPTQTVTNGAPTQTTSNGKPTQITTQTGATAPGFVISGQATGVKQSTASANATQAAAPIVARPGFVISGQSTDQKTIDRGNGIATISNGKTTSAIVNGKTITVTSTTPGMITVSNGTNSVTLDGSALSLTNAPSIMVGSNLEAHRQQDGSVIFTAKPLLPGTVTGEKTPVLSDIGDAGKWVGNKIDDAGSWLWNAIDPGLPVREAPPTTSTIVQQ